LTANLRGDKVISPFKARSEGDGYGVVVGRRRFLARKAKMSWKADALLVIPKALAENSGLQVIDTMAELRSELDLSKREKVGWNGWIQEDNLPH